MDNLNPLSKSDPMESRLLELESRIESLQKEVDSQNKEKKVSIVCFSGEWDRLFAAFTIANGALALGMEVHLFFTFWGANALKNGSKNLKSEGNRSSRLMNKMMPSSADELPLSRMNFGGMGKKAMKSLLKEKGIDDLPVLIEQSRELGAVFHCCDTSMDLFGLTCDDIIEGDKTNWCGVTSFLSLSLNSKITLFI